MSHLELNINNIYICAVSVETDEPKKESKNLLYNLGNNDLQSIIFLKLEKTIYLVAIYSEILRKSLSNQCKLFLCDFYEVCLNGSFAQNSFFFIF